MKTKVVKKLWGEELWMVNTKRYCGKILKINKKYCGSLHYHKKKDETFYVFSGVVCLEIKQKHKIKIYSLSPGDVFHIKPGMVHRFSTMDDNTLIIEISTTHKNSDVFRYERGGKLCY